MHTARASFTATLLGDGRVLMVGGRSGNSLIASAELYDPLTQVFTRTGSLTTARHKHAAARLPNGDVLILGGATIESRGVEGQFDSMEIYHPDTGSFVPGMSMQEARYKILDAVATFPDGRIVIGGAGQSVEVYDPMLGLLSTAQGAIGIELFYATATRLLNGAVLITGGYDRRLRTTDEAWLVESRNAAK